MNDAIPCRALFVAKIPAMRCRRAQDGKTNTVGKHQGKRWKSGWSRPLARIILRAAGTTMLAAAAIILGIAVFAENYSGYISATMLAVSMIAMFLIAAIVISISVTHPGWRTGVAGGIAAILSACAGWYIYTKMPYPSMSEFITQRSALAALAFGFGTVGGGIIVLGEMATDGKIPPPTIRPPTKLTSGVTVASVLFIAAVAVVAVPSTRIWADQANTDYARASNPQPGAGNWDMTTVSDPVPARDILGTPAGLLTVDGDGDDVSLAVSMVDTTNGDEIWRYRKYNRKSTIPPQLSYDGQRVALASQSRDDETVNNVTIMNTSTGKLHADVNTGSQPGKLVAFTSNVVVHQVGIELASLVARTYDSKVAWTLKPPSECGITTVSSTNSLLLAGYSCRPDSAIHDTAILYALDAETGKTVWTYNSKKEGIIPDGGIAISSDRVVIDVRRDDSASEGLFAARKYHHDLMVVTLDNGKKIWSKSLTDLGATTAPACAGTLRLAGITGSEHHALNATVSPGTQLIDETVEPGLVVLGECHQKRAATSAFEVNGYRLSDGKRAVLGGSTLGYAPGRGQETYGWFAGMPDGRIAIAVDASTDSHEFDCGLYIIGPKEDKESIETPDKLNDTAWCQSASIEVTPGGLAIGYHIDDELSGYFTVN